MPTVAIAIPNLNGELYLYETLKSLQMQIIKPDEIVLSDNHSIDRSLEIIRMFPNLDIRVIQPVKFLKMSENWNFVASHIESDWFFLLSNDDLLKNTAVKELKEKLDKIPSTIGAISFKSEIIDENSRLILGKYHFGKDKLREEHEFLKQNIKFLHINAASVAIKRDSWKDIGGFPTEYSVLHDLVFYQRMIMRWGILESKKVLGRYRVYTQRADSEARNLQYLKDFQTYEKLDLKVICEKYPDLLGRYTSSDLDNSSKFPNNVFSMKVLRIIVLSTMTLFKKFQTFLRLSGFPEKTKTGKFYNS